MGKKATVLQVGGFDEAGFPDEAWKFEENVRVVRKLDGTYSMGGYSNEELLLLVEQEKDKQEQAQEAAREGTDIVEDPTETEPEGPVAEDSDAPEQTGAEEGAAEVLEAEETDAEDEAPETSDAPVPYRAPEKQFVFWAAITGVAAKKPPKLRTHKEIKLLSPDLSELSEIDGFMECEVKVTITIPKHNAYFSETAAKDSAAGDTLQQQDLFEGDDAPVTPHMPEDGPAEPDVQLNPSDVHETPENADEAGIDPEADQSKEVARDGDAGDIGSEAEVPEQEPVTKLVCSDCGGDLLVNEDDPAQLICVDCGLIHENAAAQPLELE